IQDNNQLFRSYTQYQTILGGLQTKAVFAPNDQASATWLSDSLGTATVITKDITVSGNRFGGTLNQVSETYREHSRPLMTPDECKRLRPPKKDAAGKIIEGGDVILLRTGLNPIFARQILYFQDPYFAQKAAIPTPADLSQARRVSAGAPAAPEVVA
ncbi:MAG: type IV secretory system conjugative DNA transfer family protein, partial [Acetobacteraceae bacterium]